MDYKQLHKVWETPVNTLAFALIASLAIVAGPLGLAAYLIAIVAISAIATWVNTRDLCTNQRPTLDTNLKPN